MSEIYKFMNSAPGDPRTYQAADFADYFGSVLSTGLLHTDNVPGMAVSVVAGTLTTRVTAGKAIMKGHLYENTADLVLTHSLPEATQDRIDRIVLRLDLRNAERNIKLHVKQGVASATPVAPTLQRDNVIYEISLARVLVRKNTVQLLAGDLVDERLNEAVAGLVYSLISIPTSQFQAQWDEFMAGIEDSGFASATEFATHKAEDAIHLAGGTANAITVTTGADYSYGQFKQLHFKASANNTGNVTINVDGKGAVPALKFDGTQLTAGAIKAGKVYDWYHDTTSGGRFFLIAKASGDATAGDVLAGKTASGDDGEFAGAMVNRGSVGTQQLTAQNQIYTIPAGYHNGAGRVQATYVAGKKSKEGTFVMNGAPVAVTGLGFRPKVIAIKRDSVNFYSGDMTIHSDLFGQSNASIAQTQSITVTNDGFTVPYHINRINNGTWTYNVLE